MNVNHQKEVTENETLQALSEKPAIRQSSSRAEFFKHC
jgi:hypothetical protein